MRCRLGAVHAASEHLLPQLFFASTSSYFFYCSASLLWPFRPAASHWTHTGRLCFQILILLPPCSVLLTHYIYHSLLLRVVSSATTLLSATSFFSSPSRGRFLWDKCHVMLYGYITSVSSVWLYACVCASQRLFPVRH